MSPSTSPPLVLASSSPYRRDLLSRLGLPFRWQAPEVDETPRAGEAVEVLTARLARDKAQAVAPDHPGAVIIASDQLCSLDGRISGKPGTVEAAVAALRRARGRRVDFHTALAVLDSRNQHLQETVERFTVHFRALDDAAIADYVRRERPLDCAGAFRCEGLGIALFSRLEGDDPNALVGLPLIALCSMLDRCGVPVLGNSG